jgi:hypothetical protein
MGPSLGPPETTIFEYPMADDSWTREWRAFAEDINSGRKPSPGVPDAQAALRIVEEVYRKSATGPAPAINGSVKLAELSETTSGLSACT